MHGPGYAAPQRDRPLFYGAMATYLIGDLQGCDDALARLLDALHFDPARDRIIVLGDAVNRGPQSLPVLRRLMALGASAQTLLGNHDLHLLAVAHGVRRAHRSDTLQPILEAADRDELLDWVRRRPLALFERGWLLVHAGVLPQWSVTQTLQLADEVQQQLRGDDVGAFLRELFGNEPDSWDDALQGAARWRLVVNALTRARFVDLRNGRARLDFHVKQGGAKAPPGLLPWFAVPGRASAGTPIAFGHWSTLGLHWNGGALCLDSGCLWGGALSAVELAEAPVRWLRVHAQPCSRQREPIGFSND